MRPPTGAEPRGTDPVRADAKVHQGDDLHLHVDDDERGRDAEQQDRRDGDHEPDDVDVRATAGRQQRAARRTRAASTVTIGPTTSTRNSSGSTILPGRSSGCPATAVDRASLVDAAHDRVEAGHDGHRVGDEVVLHQHGRRAGGARTTGRGSSSGTAGPCRPRSRRSPYRPRGPSTRGPRAARPRPEQARQLGHDRPVGHVVEALVDDPEALLDLLDAEQVAVERVAALGARGRGSGRRTRAPGRPSTGAPGGRRTGRPRRAGSGPVTAIRSAVSRSRRPMSRIRRTKISFSLSSCVFASCCCGRAAHPVAEAGHELVVDVAVDAADPEVVEQHPLAGDRGEHLARSRRAR